MKSLMLIVFGIGMMSVNIAFGEEEIPLPTIQATNADFLKYFKSNFSADCDLSDQEKLSIIKKQQSCLNFDGRLSKVVLVSTCDEGKVKSSVFADVKKICLPRTAAKNAARLQQQNTRAVAAQPAAVPATGGAINQPTFGGTPTNAAAPAPAAAAPASAPKFVPGAGQDCGPVFGPSKCGDTPPPTTYYLCKPNPSLYALMCHFDSTVFDQPTEIQCNKDKVGQSFNYGGTIMSCMPSDAGSDLIKREIAENAATDIKSLKYVVPKPVRKYMWYSIKKLYGDNETCVTSGLPATDCNANTIGTETPDSCRINKCVRMDTTNRSPHNMHWSNIKDYVMATNKQEDAKYQAGLDEKRSADIIKYNAIPDLPADRATASDKK